MWLILLAGPGPPPLSVGSPAEAAAVSAAPVSPPSLMDELPARKGRTASPISFWRGGPEVCLVAAWPLCWGAAAVAALFTFSK